MYGVARRSASRADDRPAEIALGDDEHRGGGRDEVQHDKTEQVDAARAAGWRSMPPAASMNRLSTSGIPVHTSATVGERAEVPAVERERGVEDLAHRERAEDGRRHGRKDITIAACPPFATRPRTTASTSRSRPPSTSCSTSRSPASARARSPRCSTCSSWSAPSLAVLIVLAILGGLRRHASAGSAARCSCSAASWSGTATSSCSRGCGGGQTPGKRIAGHPRRHGYRARGHLRAPRPRATCSGSPTSFPRPTSSALLLVAFHPRGEAARGPGRRHGGRAATGRTRRRAERPRPRRSPAAPSMPELDDAEFRLLAQFAARQAELAPGGRARLAAGSSRRLSASAAPSGARRSDLAICSTCTPASWPAAQGSLARAGRGRRSGTRFAAQKRERWDEFERLAERAARSGLDSFGSARAARLRRPLSRGRGRPGAGPHLRRRRGDPCRGSSGSSPPGTTRSTATSGAPGGGLWIVLARECPAAIIEARGYVLVAFLAFAVPAAAGFTLLRERPALAAELLPDVMLRRAEAGAAPEGGGAEVRGCGRRRTARSWRRASSPTTCGSRSPASRVASSSGSARWSCWPTTGWRSARSPATSPTSGCSDYLLDVHPGTRRAGAVRDLGGGRGGIPAGPLGRGAGTAQPGAMRWC